MKPLELMHIRFLPVALAFMACIGFCGCGSESSDTFPGFGPDYHPFEDTKNHDEYLSSAAYPFEECTECHGADLKGNGNQTLNCYNCHGSDRHIVGFTEATEHPGYIRANRWKLSRCYNCHNKLATGGDFSFGGSCVTAGCHETPNGPENCNVCHGSFETDPMDTMNWAPPVDIERRTSTEEIGVGAHRSHLAISDTFAVVKCQTCHELPTSGEITPHIGKLPGVAEVIFSLVAIADNSEPVWNRDIASCQATYCHGGSNPVWTEVNGTWNSCGSCHSIPPEVSPHWDTLTREQCTYCHSAVIDGTGSFTAPELHVNGTVDMD